MMTTASPALAAHARVGRRCAAGLAAALIALAPLAATAQTQWKWRDTSGKVQYSDRPPPADVAEKNILARPLGAQRPTWPEPAAAAASVPVAATPGRAVDPQLEARKREAEQAEKARQKAEEERVEKARAENCNRAKAYAKSLQDGLRISRPNEKGESELLNDAQRAQELARAQQVIASDCR